MLGACHLFIHTVIKSIRPIHLIMYVTLNHGKLFPIHTLLTLTLTVSSLDSYLLTPCRRNQTNFVVSC